MLKEYVVVILLHLLLIKETKAKEDDIELTKWFDQKTEYDDAEGNCAQWPQRRFTAFSANPPVSP
jgi:hypothetical protein